MTNRTPPAQYSTVENEDTIQTTKLQNILANIKSAIKQWVFVYKLTIANHKNRIQTNYTHQHEQEVRVLPLRTTPEDGMKRNQREEKKDKFRD